MLTPLVVHLTYRLDVGGLETLMIERINRMPTERYRHAVVCLTDFNPEFARRISKQDVSVHALHKQPGLSLPTHLALYRLLRRLRPTVLHTYNLSAVEYAPVALLAGVPVRINGAHGRDAADPHGRNRRHNLLRRLMLPFYDCCYANSTAMEIWNRQVIGVPPAKSRLLSNGIDTERYRPRRDGDPASRYGVDDIVIVSVGRVQPDKDHATLLAAFALLRTRLPDLAPRLKLAIIGEGALLHSLRATAIAEGLDEAVWLPGARADVADILRMARVFALPSVVEGTPGAALEAMASGLPVVGSAVGGVPEVIEHGSTGRLVVPGQPSAWAEALAPYLTQPALAAEHGTAGRSRVLRHYAMSAMVEAYQAMYDSLCSRKLNKGKGWAPCAE
jgi:sugar transferase (PEP-CTERM/EpsH1 system associated)